MSDPFIDALHDRLTDAEGGRDARSAGSIGDAAEFSRWWDEFVDVLGQKVGAWNERRAPRSPINFTKRADGAVHVWHQGAEAIFTRDGSTIRVSSRLGDEPPREAACVLHRVLQGGLVATVAGADLPTPAAAAEHFVTPVLVKTFAER